MKGEIEKVKESMIIHLLFLSVHYIKVIAGVLRHRMGEGLGLQVTYLIHVFCQLKLLE